MNFLVHVGDAKCGSSAIQASLWEARERLRDRGILYHPAEPGHGHYAYAVLMGGKTRGDDQRYKELALQNISELGNMVNACRPRCVVLSGENLFGQSPEKMAELCGEIVREKNRLHILAFIRDPVPLYLSQIQQELTGSSVFTHPAHFKYNKCEPLKKWRKYSKVDSVIVKLFDRKHLTGGSVVSELELAIEYFAAGPINLRDSDVNAALSLEQTAIMQMFRRDFLSDTENQYSKIAHNLVRMFQEINRSVGMVGTKSQLNDAVVRHIRGKVAADVRELNETFPGLGMADISDLPKKCSDINIKMCRVDDVRSIIGAGNKELLINLKGLAIEYGGAEKKVIIENLKFLSQFGEGAARAYAVYLQRSGIEVSDDVITSWKS